MFKNNRKILSLILILSLVLLVACREDNKAQVRSEIGILEDLNEDRAIFQLETTKIELKLGEGQGLVPKKTYALAYNDNDQLLDFKELVEKKEAGRTIEKTDNRISLDEYTLVDSLTYDIDQDGKEEEIKLYTSAALDEAGEILYDDGQDWALIVETETGDYEIFKDRIQIGRLDYFAFTLDDDFYITTVNYGTANLTLTEYKLEDGVFRESQAYNPLGNLNMIHKNIR